jgi:hypothetical protein
VEKVTINSGVVVATMKFKVMKVTMRLWAARVKTDSAKVKEVIIIVIVHIKGIITIGANNVTFVDMDFNHGRFPLNVVQYLVTLATIKSMANKVTIEYLVPLEMTPSLVVQAMILLSALLPVIITQTTV